MTPKTTPNPPNTQNALVTGAAKRIGRALARGLAADGFGVCIHYAHSSEAAHELALEITKNGGRAITAQADFNTPEDVEQLVRTACDKLGSLDLLVNNASLFERDTPTTLSVESFSAHLNVNLRAPLLLCRDFARHIKSRAANETAKQSGNIVNLIDQRVWRLTPDFTSYTASKVGLWAMTQTLAQSFAPTIRVNAIGPGPSLPSARQSQNHFETQTQSVPLKKGASPDDIMDGLRYILSAQTMTGQMLALDGGQHLAWETPDIINAPE